jgi:predicted Zn-dependent peptidase
MILSSLLVVLAPVLSQDAPAAFDPAPITIGEATFVRRTLANGLQALVVDQASADPERASVFMVIGVGSGVEGPATSGLAHLVEHTLFTGTQTTGVDLHERTLNGWGAESNAYTREDYTVYYDHGFEREHLDTVLAMEADRLRNLSFDREAFLHERYRLEREEKGAFTQSDGRSELLDAAVLSGLTYSAGVRDEQGRTMGPKLGLDVVRAFYDQWYRPRYTAIVVAGDVDVAATFASIEAHFGGLAAGPAPAAPAFGASDLLAREVRYASSLPADKMYYAWVGPEMWTQDRTSLALLAAVMRERHRPKEMVASDDPAAQPIDVWMGGRLRADLFALGVAGDRAEARLDALLKELRNKPPTEQELARAADELADDFEAIPVHGRPYFSLAATVGMYAVLGDATWPARYPEALRAVTPATISAAVDRWLAPERRQTVVFEANPDATAGPERQLPDDAGNLAALAQDAADAGDLETAIAAYEKLLTMNPDRMNAVIYGFYLGSLKREAGDLAGALRDLESALEIVDYPAVRELADEIRAELEAGGAAVEWVAAKPESAMTEAPPATKPELASASHAVTLVGDLAPDGAAAPAFVSEASAIMAELEAWRGRDFTQDLVVEFILKGDAPDEKLNGWYEPDTKRLVVIENDNAAMGRGTMLHEMFHALQDQNFDLLNLDQKAFDGGTPEDSFRALRALIEGEAMFAVSELMDYDFEQHTALPETGELDAARFEKIFHYGAGLRFVRFLRDTGGWELVNEVYSAPPRFTTQIMHPDRFLAGVRPRDLSEMDAPICDCGADDHAARVLGEFGLALFLARDPATRARSAALAGRLDGDLCYTLHEVGDSTTERFAWYLAFLDRTAAEEFTQLASETLGLDVWSLDDTGRSVGVLLTSDPLPNQLGE